jgi:hypothetical protein
MEAIYQINAAFATSPLPVQTASKPIETSRTAIFIKKLFTA